MRLVLQLYCAGNFHLFGAGTGTGQHLQVFSDSSAKLGLNGVNDLTSYLVPELQNDISVGSGGEELQCTVAPRVGSMENHWYVEQVSGRNDRGVRLYFMTENGKKRYLRAHFHGTRIDLVCEDYVNSIDNVSLHGKMTY